MPLIIDVQGFKTGNNKFIVKEFAAYDGTRICHYIFKQPFPFNCLPIEYQKQANWLMSHHHAIDWIDGYTKHFLFPKIISDITTNVTEVYVKGREKADFIRKHITATVLELPETPQLEQKTANCFYHKNDICICALSNVFNLYKDFVMH